MQETIANKGSGTSSYTIEDRETAATGPWGFLVSGGVDWPGRTGGAEDDGNVLGDDGTEAGGDGTEAGGDGTEAESGCKDAAVALVGKVGCLWIGTDLCSLSDGFEILGT